MNAAAGWRAISEMLFQSLVFQGPRSPPAARSPPGVLLCVPPALTPDCIEYLSGARSGHTANDVRKEVPVRHFGPYRVLTASCTKASALPAAYSIALLKRAGNKYCPSSIRSTSRDEARAVPKLLAS